MPPSENDGPPAPDRLQQDASAHPRRSPRRRGSREWCQGLAGLMARRRSRPGKVQGTSGEFAKLDLLRDATKRLIDMVFNLSRASKPVDQRAQT